MASNTECSTDFYYSDHCCFQCLNAMFGEGEKCEEGKKTQVRISRELARLDKRILQSTFRTKIHVPKKKNVNGNIKKGDSFELITMLQHFLT